MSACSFEIKKKLGKARLGVIKTPHGDVQTPAFIFCGTKATVKSVTPKQLRDEDTQIILANTYHLMLQPGGDVLEKAGGLAKFNGWQGPTFTDSGGFQIFSLGHGSVASEIKGKSMTGRKKTLLNIDEDGATFRSYTDGKIHHLSPEKAIQLQKQIGADLIVVLDECTPFHVDYEYTARSMEMSHRWATRCIAEFDKTPHKQGLYGIIQGGIYDNLRKVSGQFVAENDFFGQAIGGSLGKSKDQMHEIVAMTVPYLHPDRPIHLLGIGGISDIFSGVENGIDTFDCVHPTRLARHGGAYARPDQLDTAREHLNLNNGQYREDFSPIDEKCPCYTCQNFTRAYIHHLLKAKELLAFTLISLHNIRFINRLMTAIRRAIETDSLEDEKRNWLS